MNIRTIRTTLAALALSTAAGLAAADGDVFDRTQAPALFRGELAFIQFNTDSPVVPPNPTYIRSSVRIEQVIELTDAHHWQSTVDVRFRDVNDNPVSHGCVNGVATRMP